MSLTTRLQDSVLTVTLNRPERLNALNAELRTALCDLLTHAADEPRARAIVITGAGDRAFCAGQDLTEAPCWQPAPDRSGWPTGADTSRR